MALICSAWGSNRTLLQQTMPCSCMHSECMQCKLLCHLLFTCSLRQSAADYTPEAPPSTHQGRGCRSCYTSHQQTYEL
eukprot:1158878-Pelagomonas_calceolata.AAC.10